MSLFSATELLERVGNHGRAEARERRHERDENVVVRRPRIERLEVEHEPEQRAHDRLGLRVERLDLDAARRRLDAQLASPGGAVQPALVPDIDPVDAERAKALRREREVERPGHGEERHARTVLRELLAVAGQLTEPGGRLVERRVAAGVAG